PLCLSQVAAVADAGENPHGVAKRRLGPRRLAALLQQPPVVDLRRADAGDVTDVRIQLMQLLVGAFRSLRAVADLVEPRLRAECCGARADAATLLGELPRLPSQRLR